MEFSFSLLFFFYSHIKKKIFYTGTGISCSKFSILERHLTYSLTQEKTTIRLYVMISMEVVTDGLVEFSIKDVLTRYASMIIICGFIFDNYTFVFLLLNM